MVQLAMTTALLWRAVPRPHHSLQTGSAMPQSLPTCQPLLFYSLLSIKWWKPVLQTKPGAVSGSLCVKPSARDMGAVQFLAAVCVK